MQHSADDGLFDGRYELGELLGSGGTGSVRRARDIVLDRPVAIKRLRHGGQDEVVRARLRAEARLASSLHHPGIAQIYDYGEDTSGDEPAPYIVMQHVDGQSLWHVLRERSTLPAAEVMDVVAQVARALQVAHDAGIVHRDLKPGNILLADGGRVVLVDFGIARALGAEPLTLTGTFIGTVDYISPEQSAGSSATHRSDLYSLGMVAYECLTGHRPFRRDSLVATALAHLHDQLPAPPADVPRAVAQLVARLVAKQPEDRPADAGEVARLAAALAADPDRSASTTTAVVSPFPTESSQPQESPVRRARRSYPVLVGAAVAATLVAGSLFVAARPATVQVPDVRGLLVEKAESSLEGRELDVERRVVDDPGTDRGVILGQDPAPGTQAEEDSLVVLRVASGSMRISRGELLGKRYAAAARILVEHGLVPARGEDIRAGDAGSVVGVDRAGRLPLGSTVRLLVAAAPAALPVPVPASTTAPAPAPAPPSVPVPDTSAPAPPTTGSTGTRGPAPSTRAGSGSQRQEGTARSSGPRKSKSASPGKAEGKSNGKSKGKSKGKGR